MYDKKFYRTTLNNYKPYIKITVIAKECGLQQPNLSKFLKGEAYDDSMSLENLDLLYNAVKQKINYIL